MTQDSNNSGGTPKPELNELTRRRALEMTLASSGALIGSSAAAIAGRTSDPVGTHAAKTSIQAQEPISQCNSVDGCVDKIQTLTSDTQYQELAFPETSESYGKTYNKRLGCSHTYFYTGSRYDNGRFLHGFVSVVDLQLRVKWDDADEVLIGNNGHFDPEKSYSPENRPVDTDDLIYRMNFDVKTSSHEMADISRELPDQVDSSNVEVRYGLMPSPAVGWNLDEQALAIVIGKAALTRGVGKAVGRYANKATKWADEINNKWTRRLTKLGIEATSEGITNNAQTVLDELIGTNLQDIIDPVEYPKTSSSSNSRTVDVQYPRASGWLAGDRPADLSLICFYEVETDCRCPQSISLSVDIEAETYAQHDGGYDGTEYESFDLTHVEELRADGNLEYTDPWVQGCEYPYWNCNRDQVKMDSVDDSSDPVEFTGVLLYADHDNRDIEEPYDKFFEYERTSGTGDDLDMQYTVNPENAGKIGTFTGLASNISENEDYRVRFVVEDKEKSTRSESDWVSFTGPSSDSGGGSGGGGGPGFTLPAAAAGLAGAEVVRRFRDDSEEE